MTTDRTSEAATLSALLESLPDPALLVDVKRRVRAVNEAFRARIPRPGTAVGAHCFELLHGRRQRCVSKDQRCPLDLCVGTAAPAVAFHAHVAEGRRCPERIVLRPLVDDDGKVVACLATLEPLQPGAFLKRKVPGRWPVAVAAVRTHLPRLVRSRSPVLLFGEAGTGKSSVARAIHGLSRSRGPFEERSGCELAADGLRALLASGSAGGTLYLSDVHALGREAQDVLWEWLTRRAGGRRLIVGTDRDLGEGAAAGAFRADLLARLAVHTLQLPPLRDRLGELPEIAAGLLREAEGPGHTLAPEALERLLGYPFPGNLDELTEALSHASLMATGPTVRAEDLPERITGGGQ